MDEISQDKREKWNNFIDELTRDFVIDPLSYIDLKHYALSEEFDSKTQDVIIAVLDLCLDRARQKRIESGEIWKKFPNFA